MKKLAFLFLGFALTTSVAWAQDVPMGGKKSFAFLNNPTNAKLAGIGGMNVSSGNGDINMFLANPALLSKESHNHLSVNYAPYLADINLTQVAYGYSNEKIGNLAVGFINMGYGTMDRTDAGGNRQGTFSANDYAIVVGYSKTKGEFTLGSNLKYVGSQIDGISASALGLDLGALWAHPKRDFKVGLAVKNIGLLSSGYDGEGSAEIPLNVQLGASYKLEHMPLRFSATAHTLQTWDITYLDPNKTEGLDQNGNPIRPQKTFGDQLLRHFTFGAEFLLGKSFNIRASYNHQLNRELRLEDASAGSGWALGAMVKIKAFEFGLTRGWYHASGGVTFLTLTTNFNRLFTRKVVESAPTEPATPRYPPDAAPATN